MKLDDALRTLVPFGKHSGRTIGWILKFQPDGVSYLRKGFADAKVYGDVREAIRSVLAAPKLRSWLKKKAPDIDFNAYLLPATDGGCLACGGKKLSSSAQVFCRHGHLRPHWVDVSCECGWETRIKQDRHTHCVMCDEFPLFPGLKLDRATDRNQVREA